MPQASLLSFFSSPVGGTKAAVSASEPELKRQVISPSPRGRDVSKGKQKPCSLPSNSTAQPNLDQPNHVSAEYEGKSKIVSAAQQVTKEADGQQATTSPDGTFPLPAAATNSVRPFILANCPSITISSVQSEHLDSLMRLTTSLLPIQYPRSFYTDLITDPPHAISNPDSAATFSRVALYTPPTSTDTSETPTPTPIPIPIGWIRCSLEPYAMQTTTTTAATAATTTISDQPTATQIYIKALCLHPTYRGLGIATALLDSLLLRPNHQHHQQEHQQHQQEQQTAALHNVRSIYAHVWISNEEALEWYEKRGFRRLEWVEGYYRKLRPAGAWVVGREVEVG